jgi:flavin-dependent dehydrogenase
MTGRPIEIIGGGLAGLSLGIALRRERVPVTLHEAGRYPRHRVCGEFIAGLAPSTIARLGLAAELHDALQHNEVAWTVGSRPARIQQLPAPALGLSRHILDARLARRLVEEGGELHTQARVTDVGDTPGRVFATGRRPASNSRWIGLKVHLAELPLLRNLEMHVGTEAYVGLARIPEGVNVCGLFRRRGIAGRGAALLIAYLRAAGLEVLADRIARAPLDSASFCAVAALDFGRGESRRDGVWLGDASAMIPPFTGNGMAMAFQSAEVALTLLLAYSRGDATWPATCRAIQHALHGRFRVRLASAQALHPFLLRPLHQRWFAAISRARLLPFRALYAALH